LRTVDGTAIRERLQILRLEVAEIREENRRYLQQPHHRYVDERLHKDREARRGLDFLNTTVAVPQ